jgi:cytochrome c
MLIKVPVLGIALAAAMSALTFPAFAADESARSAGQQITRPAGYKPMAGDVKLGARLWKDTKLSTNGISCHTCHADHGAFQSSFAKPYPHTVDMAKDQMGRKTVHLDEMIQACMVMPMEAKPLPWNSKELAALTAYVQTVQKSFQSSSTSK